VNAGASRRTINPAAEPVCVRRHEEEECMKFYLRIIGLILAGAMTVGLLGGCSAEETGEDVDQLGEEVDFDRQ
jgi:hypothetical protein